MFNIMNDRNYISTKEKNYIQDKESQQNLLFETANVDQGIMRTNRNSF